MRHTLALALLLFAATTATANAETVAAHRGTHAFTTTEAFVQVLDGPTDTHSATIDTRLYVPDNATAATPQPAILMTNGFGLSKDDDEVLSSATFFARHGYVVLTYSGQGFGKSSGCVTLQSRTYDVKDAQQLITKVLASKAFVKKDAKGPIVGMTGGSYGGGIELNLAENDPRIRAINPSRTWNDLRYSLVPNNWVVPDDPTGFTHTLTSQGVFKQQWASLFFAVGMSGLVGGLPPTGSQTGGCPQDKLASGDPLTVAGLGCTGFYAELCEAYVRISATGDVTPPDRKLLADSSGATEMSKLKVPTLLFQGQSDTLFNLNDAVATYTALRRAGTPVQMVWNSGGHGGYDSLPGECDVYGSGTGGADFRGLDSCYLTLRTLAFFDRWLRGIPDPSPNFTYFRDWTALSGIGSQYGSAPAFPLAGTRTYTLAGSTLVTGAAPAGSVTMANPAGGVPPAYSETSNFMGPNAVPRITLPPTEIPGQHVAFTTEPFPTAVESVGVPSLRVTLSHVAPTDLVLFGKVYDVAPDGSATLIRRMIAPARIPNSALSRPVDLKLIGFAHRFAAGHRLRLTLATTDATSYNNKVADVITVATGSGNTLTINTVVPAAPPAATPQRPRTSPGALPATGLPASLPLLALGFVAAAVLLHRRRVGKS